MKLTHDSLSQAVKRTTAAFRCRTKLQPADGPGGKVFPPTYAGAVYAVEMRRVPDGKGSFQTVLCVLLDSVQAQANRMEEALQEALDIGKLTGCPIPVLNVDFTDLGLLNEVRRVTSLEAPHRVADAILRDSLYDGQPFRKSTLGAHLDAASLQNATPLYQLCPTALIFGLWDSTGPKGGLGAKFQRAVVSEIVGVNAQIGKKTSSRIDPLQIYRQAGPVFRTPDGSWTIDATEALKDKQGRPILFGRNSRGEDVALTATDKIPDQGRPSVINHGNVTPDVARYADNINSSDPVSGKDSITKGGIAPGGVTIEYAEQTVVISLPALRRLRFPVGGKTTPEIRQERHAARLW